MEVQSVCVDDWVCDGIGGMLVGCKHRRKLLCLWERASDATNCIVVSIVKECTRLLMLSSQGRLRGLCGCLCIDVCVGILTTDPQNSEQISRKESRLGLWALWFTSCDHKLMFCLSFYSDRRNITLQTDRSVITKSKSASGIFELFWIWMQLCNTQYTLWANDEIKLKHSH